MTIGGTLTNTSTNGNGISIGNTGITSADTVTVNGTGGLSNSSGEINIEGSATVQATLNVANAAAGFGTAGVETGTVFLQNDALLEFKTGQITTVNGELWLDGAKSRVADAGATGSNSALTGLTTVAGSFFLENGATVATTGNVSVIGNGQVGARREQHRRPRRQQPDDRREADAIAAPTATALDVGNTGITSADILTVNGTGGLSNGSTSEINIEGNATVQATLNVANAAAGFGTTGVETGTVFLQNDALLEFKSGQITTVNGELWLDGANARVADAGALTSNSALTGLTTVAGSFYLENGATVAPTGNLSVIGSGRLELDGNNTGGAGGSSLTIGGKLTQQQHRRQRRLGRQHRHHFGRHFDGERDGRALQRQHQRDQHRRQRHRPGDPERRQCGGGVRHGKGWRPGRSSSKTTRSWNSRAARSRRSTARYGSSARTRGSPTPARPAATAR